MLQFFMLKHIVLFTASGLSAIVVKYTHIFESSWEID